MPHSGCIEAPAHPHHQWLEKWDDSPHTGGSGDKQFLPNCPLRQATDPENWAHRFATHLQQCFSQLRTLLQEENTHKFAKTGAFRRLCDSTQWVVVSGLTSRLNLTPPWAMSSPTQNCTSPLALSSPTQIPTRSLALTSSQISRTDVEVDKHGYPLIFQTCCGALTSPAPPPSRMASAASPAPPPSRVASVESLASMGSSVASTLFYKDESGFPTFAKQSPPNDEDSNTKIKKNKNMNILLF